MRCAGLGLEVGLLSHGEQRVRAVWLGSGCFGLSSSRRASKQAPQSRRLGLGFGPERYAPGAVAGAAVRLVRLSGWAALVSAGWTSVDEYMPLWSCMDDCGNPSAGCVWPFYTLPLAGR